MPPTTLIIVCCHGIYLGGPNNGHSESEWLIAPFQCGETPTFIEHVRAGISCLSRDDDAVLVFSGYPPTPFLLVFRSYLLRRQRSNAERNITLRSPKLRQHSPSKLLLWPQPTPRKNTTRRARTRFLPQHPLQPNPLFWHILHLALKSHNSNTRLQKA